MLPRFLVVSKYEVKQYKGSIIDEAVVLLVVLASFLMLVQPQVEQTSLPSSHKIYRIGYVQGTMLGSIDSYTLQLIPYADDYGMMQDSSLNRIDGFGVFGRNGIVVFGSGTPKSDAALTHLNSILAQFNTNRVFDYIAKDGNLSGILLPLRLQIIPEEIDYKKAMGGTVDAQRRQIFGVRTLASTAQAATQAKSQLDSDGLTVPLVTSATAAQGVNASAESYVGASNQSGSGGYTLPTDLTVEFPFRMLYKNMALLSPLMLLSMLLSLSLARERIDRNIENLFNSPLSNAEILFGKSLPYLAVMAALSLFYGLQVTHSLDALKIALVFMVLSSTMLSFSLFSVIISRSYRELTFVGSFSMFAFFLFIVLPNVFSGVNVLSFISPLDTITSIENGASMSAYDLVLSLLPYCFLSMFFVTFTALCFKAEVLFSSMDFKSLLRFFYFTLERFLENRASYIFISVSLLVPFVFIIESIMAYLALPLGSLAPFVSLILLAAIEEMVKIIPYYFRRTNPLLYGLIAGASFFLMEKLFNIYLIVKVYSYLGGPYLLFFTQLVPTLLLHMLSTCVFALIISRKERVAPFVVGLLTAVSVHVTYNYMLLRGLM
jgi:hypothetical protein